MSTDIENYIFDLSRELRIEGTQGVSGNELELIALVKNCPFLYDKSRKDFKNLEKRDATWKAIALVMHSTVIDCQTRWKCLREQYGRIRRAITTHDPEAGRMIQWEFIEDMKFLDPHIRPRRSSKRDTVFKMPDSESSLIIQSLDDENYSIEWLDEPKSPDNKELKLITLIKSFPLLYDKNHEDNKDIAKKDLVWTSVSKAMGYSVFNCQTRWKALREKYGRERKLKKSDPYHKVWKLYEEMSFLDKHVRERNSRLCYRPILPKPENFDNVINSTTSGVIINPELSNDLNFHVQKLEYVDPSFENGINIDNSEPMCSSPASIVDGTKSEISNKPNTSVLDEDDLFGQSIAAELKKISGRRKKIKLKADIFKLLYDYECDDSN